MYRGDPKNLFHRNTLVGGMDWLVHQQNQPNG